MDNQPEEEHIVSGIFDNYNETQREILVIETRKTRNMLFMIAVVIFLFGFLGLASINFLSLKTILAISVVPVIMAVLALLAGKEPLLAMIIATLIFAGLWIYSIDKYGGRAIIAGWLEKVALICLLFAGFQNAREAQRIKKELKI